MENITNEREEMSKKVIMTFEIDERDAKQLRNLAKKRERSAGFSIRKAIAFWLAHGAPEAGVDFDLNPVGRTPPNQR